MQCYYSVRNPFQSAFVLLKFNIAALNRTLNTSGCTKLIQSPGTNTGIRGNYMLCIVLTILCVHAVLDYLCNYLAIT